MVTDSVLRGLETATFEATPMTHVPINWPPDCPQLGLHVGFSIDTRRHTAISPKNTSTTSSERAEAIGLSIALNYFGVQSQHLDPGDRSSRDVLTSWRIAKDRVIAAPNQRNSDTPAT